jgi:hypothetical protein
MRSVILEHIRAHGKKLISNESSDTTILKSDFLQKLHTVPLKYIEKDSIHFDK